MTIALTHIGCDISKQFLDFYDPAFQATQRLPNTAEAAEHLVSSLRGRKVVIVMEATGSYDRALRTALTVAGLPYVRVNPARARHFARAAGFLAKTDAVDARMLSTLGQSLKPVADAPEDPNRAALAALHKRRDQLVEMRAEEKTRRHEAVAEVRACLDAHIAWLSQSIRELEQKIAALVRATPILKADAMRLRSAPGIGPVTAVTLLALMPELGRLTPKKIASLAGIAPVNNDSGTLRGKRSIRGGRRRVRQALYMAALSAIRHNTRFNDVYTRIALRAKAKKIAIIAVARKLLITLNAMLRDQTVFA